MSHPACNGVVQRDHGFPRPACADALPGLVLGADVQPLIVGLADVQGLAVFQLQFIAGGAALVLDVMQQAADFDLVAASGPSAKRTCSGRIENGWGCR
jgi:hypothetical protein